ncbi:Glycoside Hydrolase Family 28 protein [Tuber magnatum]|uniref:galacturonan 1,4-alpha-galacturonidase n=1 Tax=Tuber magnatum TaxID=42249 RepID=A0A317T277_9PEZI|nr:Glycoside Hydrolase Family 28 protein [Tuber magnatum]
MGTPNSISSPKDYYQGKPQKYQFPARGNRKKVNIRASCNETDDISADFLEGIKKANNGGTLVLKKGKKYVIGKKLDLTFLNDIQVQLDGQILFTNDIEYWQKNYFAHPFQNSISFWQWGGKDIVIKGEGEINGNGQVWYDGFAGKQILDPNNTYLRPVLFTTVGATGLSIKGIAMRNSPCWTNFLTESTDIYYDDVSIEAVSINQNRPKNTDGWDTYNVDRLTVTNSRANIGDDCFSPKPNTTNVFVQNLWCNGTNGVSMGSIGQYPGVMDIIENIYIQNVTMLNSRNGARLKAWAGSNVGYGRINNVTYEDFYVDNVDYPLILDQCYFNLNETECAKHPSEVDFTSITFINFSGKSSAKRGRVTVEAKCSENAVCEDIFMEEINVHSPSGDPAMAICDGIKGGIGIPCFPANATEAKTALKDKPKPPATTNV